jgi:hexosaminidase
MQNSESLAWMRGVKAQGADQALAAFWADLATQTLAQGKVPMGWDDITLLKPPRGPLPPATIVQWWDDPKRALAALKAGHPVVASWKETTYLDYPELDGDGDRAWWMPALPARTVATQPFWPPGTPVAVRSQVLGVEATLFTERVTQGQWGRKLFPRLSLVAELAWRGVPSGVPGWAPRLEAHRQRLEVWGVGMPEPLR